MSDDADTIDPLVLGRLESMAKKRYAMGRDRFGITDLTTDKRNFIEETLEELIDCAWYMAARLVQLQQYEQRQEPEQLELFSEVIYGERRD